MTVVRNAFDWRAWALRTAGLAGISTLRASLGDTEEVDSELAEWFEDTYGRRPRSDDPLCPYFDVRSRRRPSRRVEVPRRWHRQTALKQWRDDRRRLGHPVPPGWRVHPPMRYASFVHHSIEWTRNRSRRHRADHARQADEAARCVPRLPGALVGAPVRAGSESGFLR